VIGLDDRRCRGGLALRVVKQQDNIIMQCARAAKLMVDLAGASPADGAYPVAIVAISGSEKSDRLAGSPEVKVSVG
jgi:hypothetical protein